MAEPRELVDPAQVGTALAVLSVVALLAVPVLVYLSRKRRLEPWMKGALLSGAAVLVWPLWMVYNRIEDHFGLDSVAALLINLVLFLVVGVAGGWVLRRLWPSEAVESDSPRRHGEHGE